MAEVETVLVTGCAGFIGMHLTKGLLKSGFRVVGLDNLNDYYDPGLKVARLRELGCRTQDIVEGQLSWGYEDSSFGFIKGDIKDLVLLDRLINEHHIHQVFHLAAQAGVRYSTENPHAYIESNVVGTTTLLQACKQQRIKHIYLASSSSVYGAISEAPFVENMNCNAPMSIYAASKASTELIAHAYSKLFDINVTALRFFTVYGPWDRPDMAMHRFVERIASGSTIEVYNNGEMQRDFTYVKDLVDMVIRLVAVTKNKNDSGFRVLNVGSGSPIPLAQLIAAIEKAVGKKATMQYLPMQLGDLKQTYADTTKISEQIGRLPKTSLDIAIGEAVRWNLEYYASCLRCSRK